MLTDTERLRLEHCELMLNGMQLALLKIMNRTPGISQAECDAFERCFVNSREQIAITNAEVAERVRVSSVSCGEDES